jgi:hypothetical protein
VRNPVRAWIDEVAHPRLNVRINTPHVHVAFRHMAGSNEAEVSYSAGDYWQQIGPLNRRRNSPFREHVWTRPAPTSRFLLALFRWVPETVPPLGFPSARALGIMTATSEGIPMDEKFAVAYEPKATFFRYYARVGEFNYAFPAIDKEDQGVWFDDSAPAETPSTFCAPPNETVRSLIEANAGTTDGTAIAALVDAFGEQYQDAIELLTREYAKVSS